MTRMTRLLITLLFLSFLPAAVHASAVGNCDKKAHELVVNIAGETRAITLEAGRSLFFFGPMTDVSVDGRKPVRLDQSFDYCIWRDSFGPQKRSGIGHNRHRAWP